MGLQKKIFLYVGVGLAVLMVPLTWLSLQTIDQAVDMVRQERLTLVESIALDIDDIIEHLRTEIVTAALVLGQGWEDDLTDAHKEHLTSVWYHLQQDLGPLYQIEQAVFVTVLNVKGEVLWVKPYLDQKVTQSLADTTAVRKVAETGQVYIKAEEILLTQDSPALSLIAPIKDDQEVVRGILIAGILARSSNGAFSFSLRRLRGAYDLELVTGSGLVLASAIPGQAIEGSSHWEVIRHLAQERRSGIETHSHPNSHMVAFAPLEQVPWGVILVQQEAKVLELPWVMGRRLLLMSGLAVLGVAGLTWIVTRQIVSPLQRLAATAQEFGDGNLEVQVPAMGRDEIGRLAESLDTMRQQLKHSLDEIKQWNQELEQRVEQRTKELEELDQQLREQDKERGDLLGKIIITQEEERQRIARELHDEVGQSLTSLMIGFKMLETQNSEGIRKGITNLKQLTAQTLDEVHHLALELRPSSLDDLGLIAALRQYTREYSNKFGVNADFHASGFKAKRLQPQTEITLYRIIQEALTNVAKHSEAKKVSVLMRVRNSSIIAIVEDNGKGFDVKRVLASRTRERKLGLYGMQERAALIDGVLTIESTPGVGTTIFVEVPLKGDEVK